jgi:UDP-N-acetylmuramate--alanine ligase
MIGIGGVGMSGIAEVLLNTGFTITGSDLSDSEATRRLQSLGARIHAGHDAAYVRDADMVVYSSAVPATNPELREARDSGLLVIRRAEMLGELMRMKYGIGVAGTHGKTSTTSLVGQVLTQGGLDPTIIVGGKVRSLKTHAKLGVSDFLVAEADEFDRSFLRLSPTYAVITSIEAEHLDTYGSLEAIKDAFVEFANKVPFFGSVIVCLDEPEIRNILPRINRRIVTYGVHPDADIRAEHIALKGASTTFQLHHNGDAPVEITLQCPGEHFAKNSLAAVALGEELGMDPKDVAAGIASWTGVHRRFDIKSEARDIMIVDDYAHHPTEVRATLQAARDGWPDRRIIAVFQPHLYSRTRDFSEEFGNAFTQADILVIADVFGSREPRIPGVTGELIVDAARHAGHPDVRYIPTIEDIETAMGQLAQPGDLLITMGAGSIWKVSEGLSTSLDG